MNNVFRIGRRMKVSQTLEELPSPIQSSMTIERREIPTFVVGKPFMSKSDFKLHHFN